jgi:branched-chain amino acid transport system permease protein
LLGALVVKTLGEFAKLATGDAPGLDLVIYGCVLIVVVAVAPRGIAGMVSDVRLRVLAPKTAVSAPSEGRNG